jgi:hypothetical protein
MKKLLIFLLLFFKILHAGPCKNPAAPKIIKKGFFIPPSKWFNFRAGYEGNFIYNRRFLQRSTSKRINKFEQDLNSGILVINILNRLDLYGCAGKGLIKANWIINTSDITFSHIEMETRYKFAWSSGVKVIFFEWGDTTFSLGGRYSFTKPEIRWISKDGEVLNIAPSRMTFDEWQVDMGISYKIDFLIPYACAKYSKAKSKIAIDGIVISSDGRSELYLKNKNRFGMALGCSFSSSKYFMFNLEVRLIDEEAFDVSGEFKF